MFKHKIKINICTKIIHKCMNELCGVRLAFALPFRYRIMKFLTNVVIF